MKIDDLFEALPGTPKQGFFSRMFGGNSQAKQIKASVDQGVKSWMQYAETVSRQNSVPGFNDNPTVYAKVFRQWASKATNLNVNHPALNDIETGLATTIRGRSDKPIKDAVAKVVNLTQSMMVNPESRYTPEMKAQAVSNLIDKKYGKYIKDIATKQAIDKFINDTIKADPTLKAEDLQKAAEAEIAKIVGGTSPNPRGGPPSIPGGTTQTAGGVEYVWNGSEWRNSTTGASATAAIASALTASVTRSGGP
jgi:hypothetical protein